MSDESVPVPDLGTPEPSEPIPPLVDAGLEPEQPRRRRRGKYEPPPPTQPPPTAEPISPNELDAIGKALGMGFRVVFAMVATKRGEHWQLSEGDEKMLGDNWAIALAPWLKDTAKYAPLALAALATVGVVMPRVQQDAALVAALEVQQTPRRDEQSAARILE